jgi:phosphate butyryltransferase
MFRNFQQVVDYARKLETKDLIVANPEDRAIIIAINDAYLMGLIRPVLVGDKKKILDLLMELGISKNGYEIYNTQNKQDAAMMSVKLVSKQSTAILMKGQISSGRLLGEVLNEEYGLKQKSLLSHIGVLDIPNYHKLLFIADSEMNVQPDEKEKINILENTYNFVSSLGIFKPKVVLIGADESISKGKQSRKDADNIINKLKDTDEYYIGGPYTIDIALSHEAAGIKDVNHVVAGDADILIFPCVESGNTFYKTTTILGNSTAAGLLLGATNPIVLTSRTDSYKSRLYSIALAVVSTDIL